MKNRRIHLLGWVVLFTLLSPAVAQDTKESEPDPDEDTILGTWHVQVMEGELMPADESVRITFNKDGTVLVFEGDREEESGQYLHDEDQAKITIYEDNDPTDVEAILKYSFLDDMLVMRLMDDPGRRGEQEEEVIELTRNPKGTERHQKMRAERGDKPGPRERNRRMMRLRQLYMAVMAYMADHREKMPDSLGDVVVGGYIDLDTVLSATAGEKPPKDFDDWKAQDKADWINQRTGCVYLKVDLKAENAAEQIALFDVPTKGKEQITLIFADGHGEAWDLKKANKAIKNQTGHALDEWMKSPSPGLGALPKKKER